MGPPLYHVDAFTDRPFAGNPAAVVLLDKPADAAWMQNVAAEMNLSETAFLAPETGVDTARFGLRWFTPAMEVDLCGHATLASAHVLWETGVVAGGAPIVFATRSGDLCAEREADGAIALDFPALAGEPVDIDDDLVRAIGTRPVAACRARFDLLVELADAAAVRSYEPNLPALKAGAARGLIVTARSDDAGYDFISRFFAPAAGIDEDPVTGSAHCVLGPYWASRLGRDALTGYQASSRGGVVGVRVMGERVRLAGHAVTTASGHLNV